MDIPAPPQLKQSPYLLPLQMGSYEKMKRRDYDLRQQEQQCADESESKVLEQMIPEAPKPNE
jgi:hypothetical protein